MALSMATWWWVLAGLIVAAELATGTFYLLMIALGMVAGALAAHAGFALTAQIVVAAVLGGGSTAVWHWSRLRDRASELPVHANRDVNIDIGEPVHVDTWAGDRTARVSYRGSTWSARLLPGALPATGLHRVAAVEGNWLVLAPVTAA